MNLLMVAHLLHPLAMSYASGILAAAHPLHEPPEQRARHDAFDKRDSKRLDEQCTHEGDGYGTLAWAYQCEIAINAIADTRNW